MHPYDRILAAAQYLQMNGLSNEQLNRLYPAAQKGATDFNAVKDYFTGHRDLEDSLQAFANRLCYVADQYSRYADELGQLVDRALDVWPHANPDMGFSNAHMRRASGQEARVFAYV